MNKVTENEKKSLGQKLLEFQKSGLQSYGKYLSDQLEKASQSDSKKAYRQYIEDQIARNNEKIAGIEEKLK